VALVDQVVEGLDYISTFVSSVRQLETDVSVETDGLIEMDGSVGCANAVSSMVVAQQHPDLNEELTADAEKWWQ
jgi:hypothetical protein